MIQTMCSFYSRIIAMFPDKPILVGRDRTFSSSVLVPFINHKGEEQVVFEKRAADIRQGGEICFPGGIFDPETDSSYKDTAIRETSEELGISAEKIRVDTHLGYMSANIGASLDIYAGRLLIDSVNQFKPSPDEVEKIILIPLNFFLKSKPETYQLDVELKPETFNEKGEKVISFPAEKLGLPEKYHKPWIARKAGIFVYRYSDTVIWGLTAAIMHEISQIINNGLNKG